MCVLSNTISLAAVDALAIPVIVVDGCNLGGGKLRVRDVYAASARMSRLFWAVCSVVQDSMSSVFTMVDYGLLC